MADLLHPSPRTSMSFEQNLALRDAQIEMYESGKDYKLDIHTTTNVVRDSYGSVKSRKSPKSYNWRGMVTRNPQRREREASGILEHTSLLLSTPALDWINASIDFYKIDEITPLFIVDGETYEIKEKTRAQSYYNIYLHYNFALERSK